VIILEKFSSLPTEKQNMIIDAALACFGANGYKKASIGDVAAAAGIAKASIFHYFGTKKALYFYLLDFCMQALMNEINEKFDDGITDFFDRIRLSTSIELSIMKQHPAMLSFLDSMYFENDSEVKDDIKTILTSDRCVEMRSRITFDGMDASKFKDGIDPKLVLKILSCFVDGYLAKAQNNAEVDLDVLCKEVDECLNLFKSNFYKEKYI